ncbi:MAG: 3'-5' exonuclease domain-containing protein 2 [Bacteroidetes bacterium]|nr:3'-5' exonuclease domain-containing protein 2 [Bacteroidota bacterium]
MYLSNISNSEIDKLEILKFEGQIDVIDNNEKLSKSLQELKKCKILGFDTETKPNFKKGIKNRNHISLIQLANDKKAYLIRINKIGFPNSLLQILADPKILKVGIGLKDDLKGLLEVCKLNNGSSKNCYINSDSFLDIQNIACNFGIEALSLKKLSAIVLDYKISKSAQLSNWENTILTKKQQQYAAIDAFVCLKIYYKLFDN